MRLPNTRSESLQRIDEVFKGLQKQAAKELNFPKGLKKL